MTGPRGHDEAGLEPHAAAMLQALRTAEAMPAAAEARIWARLAAATEEPESWSKDKVSRDRSRWAWAAVMVAAAAALLLASRAGVLGPLVGTRGGEAASYSEGPGTGPGVVAPGPSRSPSAASEALPEEHVLKDMVVETGAAAGAELTGPPEPPGRAPRTTGREPRAEEAKSRPRVDPEREPSAPAASTLAQEAEALARAQAAIQGERAEEALAVLGDYSRQFPAGAMREEHDALRALALCAAGRTIEGRGEAKAFLSTRGGSALAERVRRGCLAE